MVEKLLKYFHSGVAREDCVWYSNSKVPQRRLHKFQAFSKANSVQLILKGTEVKMNPSPFIGFSFYREEIGKPIVLL